MGSMTSSPLSLVGVIVASVFSVVQGQLVKRQAKALEQLKDKAPHILKPAQTPQQSAHGRSMAWSHGIMTAIIVILLIGVSILTGVSPDYMAWSLFFDIQTYSQLYDILRYAGLFWIGVACLVFYRSHVAYLGRLSHVTPYWMNIPSNIPLSALPVLYAQRDDDADLKSLRSDVYRFVRDPEAAANRLFALGIVLSSCSWLLCLLCGAMAGSEQLTVVKRDMVWTLLYGPIYDTYRADRGGQFFCTCFNKSETRCEQSIRNKLAELALPLTTTTTTTTEEPGYTAAEDQQHAHPHPRVHPHASV